MSGYHHLRLRTTGGEWHGRCDCEGWRAVAFPTKRAIRAAHARHTKNYPKRRSA